MQVRSRSEDPTKRRFGSKWVLDFSRVFWDALTKSTISKNVFKNIKLKSRIKMNKFPVVLRFKWKRKQQTYAFEWEWRNLNMQNSRTRMNAARVRELHCSIVCLMKIRLFSDRGELSMKWVYIRMHCNTWPDVLKSLNQLICMFYFSLSANMPVISISKHKHTCLFFPHQIWHLNGILINGIALWRQP